MSFTSGVIAGVVGLLALELAIALVVWTWLTRRRDDAPEEADQ